MKKVLLTLITLLILSITLVGCSSNTTNVEDENYASEDSKLPASEESIEPPVSNVTDGTGLPGTWELERVAEGGTFDMVLAINDDDTFELYLDGEAPGFLNASFRTLLAGKYTDEDNQLKLEFDDPEKASIELNLNSYTFTYSVDGDMLTLINDGTTYELTRVTETTDAE